MLCLDNSNHGVRGIFCRFLAESVLRKQETQPFDRKIVVRVMEKDSRPSIEY